LSHPVNKGPIIKRIPKAARTACAKLLSQLLKSVVQTPNNTVVWSDLLSFGSNVLTIPKRGGHKRSLVKVIQDRVSSWRSVSSACSSEETSPTQNSHPVRPTRQSKTQNDQYLAKAVSCKLEEGDIKGVVRLVCSEDKPAPNTAETLAALKKKHPPAAVYRRPACNTNSPRFDPVQLYDVNTVHKVIRSFPAGSSGGPDGITPQHLKDLTSPDVTVDLTEVINDFVNLLLSGDLPTEVREIFFGGNLIAVEKKDGGIMPITIGYTWRRLAAKCANLLVVGKMSQILSPLQLGVGVPGGAEAAIHAARRYVSQMPDSHVVVKLDFTNAFNTLR
jgi:hypothetical protein